jgi:hypothetical protein
MDRQKKYSIHEGGALKARRGKHLAVLADVRGIISEKKFKKCTKNAKNA